MSDHRLVKEIDIVSAVPFKYHRTPVLFSGLITKDYLSTTKKRKATPRDGRDYQLGGYTKPISFRDVFIFVVQSG